MTATMTYSEFTWDETMEIRDIARDVIGEMVRRGDVKCQCGQQCQVSCSASDEAEAVEAYAKAVEAYAKNVRENLFTPRGGETTGEFSKRVFTTGRIVGDGDGGIRVKVDDDKPTPKKTAVAVGKWRIGITVPLIFEGPVQVEAGVEATFIRFSLNDTDGAWYMYVEPSTKRFTSNKNAMFVDAYGNIMYETGHSYTEQIREICRIAASKLKRMAAIAEGSEQ